MNPADVRIIGGGPAGMIAAIQLKRYGLNPLLFESGRLGGLLWNANLVENYPGFPGGIPGPALVKQISRQFTDLGLIPIREEVLEIDYQPPHLISVTASGIYPSRTLVIATGTAPNQFPSGLIPPEASDRVHYEVAGLLDIREANIGIIGAGDAAFDYALNLAARKNRVTIFNRGDEIKALPLLVDRTENVEEIHYLTNQTLSAVRRDQDKLALEMVDGEDRNVYKVDVLIGAIGRSERRPPFTPQLAAAQPTLIKENRLHLIGDTQNGIYRQTAIAVGDGLKAAMKIYQFLKENQDEDRR
jgi:thioredoxin reductase